MKIGVIGGGTVGYATARAFATIYETRIFDIVPERRTHSLRDVLDTNLVFICLPTPQQPNSMRCDTRIIEELFSDMIGPEIAGWRLKTYVLRSTVPIGFTRRICNRYGLPNLVHSPEFLTSRFALHDAMMPTRNIIGAPHFAHGGGCGPGVANLRDVYTTRFPSAPIFEMPSEESEAVKLAQNSFSAVKIAFFNELRTLTDRLGLDWQRVLSALLAGGWINPMHTQVPGPDGQRGFGGACLPKDLASLISTMDEHDLQPGVMRAAYDRNELIDRLNKSESEDDSEGAL